MATYENMIKDAEFVEINKFDDQTHYLPALRRVTDPVNDDQFISDAKKYGADIAKTLYDTRKQLDSTITFYSVVYAVLGACAMALFLLTIGAMK